MTTESSSFVSSLFMTIVLFCVYVHVLLLSSNVNFVPSLSITTDAFMILQQRPLHTNTNHQQQYYRDHASYASWSLLSSIKHATSTTNKSTTTNIDGILRTVDTRQRSSNTIPTTTTNVKNLNSVYPTLRGTTVDARQIVSASGTRTHITAIYIAHCLVYTEQLADDAIYTLRTTSNSTDFTSLVTSLSACNITRHENGIIGWLNVIQQPSLSSSFEDDAIVDTTTTTSNVNNPIVDTNEHLNAILPKDGRDTLLNMITKPGDIVIVQSSRGYHIIQILDVMVNVRNMITKRPRKYITSSITAPTLHRQPFDTLPNNTNTFDFFSGDVTYKLESMGCQMNTADSERMEGQLLHLGIRPYRNDDPIHPEPREPDIIILNTCSIRDHAEQKVYSYLGPHAKRKREGDNVTIIVAGCVAQQEGIQLLRRSPEIDLVMGPQYVNRIGDLLLDVQMGNQVLATSAIHIMEDITKPRRSSSVVAWVNVIYGCNERCTFCIVPTTRGVEQSRPVESIVREVQDLVQEQGYKEITLLGQNIDAYGRDMIPKRKFSDLIRTIGSISGLERLRFVTSHPRYMSMGVIDAVAETSTACESFHIPFQSGSNTILSLMGRGHTREKYLQIVDRIRTKIPDASITADVIVGFPGETEDDFEQTLDLMRRVIFDSVNTAAYSPRPNTPAAIWENQIDDAMKQDRLQRINKLNLEHAYIRRKRMMDCIVPVLIEERNIKNPSKVMGRTRHGYIVYCDGDIDQLRGQTVNVKIDTTETYYLSGVIVD